MKNASGLSHTGVCRWRLPRLSDPKCAPVISAAKPCWIPGFGSARRFRPVGEPQALPPTDLFSGEASTDACQRRDLEQHAGDNEGEDDSGNGVSEHGVRAE